MSEQEPKKAHLEPEIVVVGSDGSSQEGSGEEEDGNELADEVQQPAKVMRIAAMVRTLLEEVRAAPLDDASRTRMKEIFETSVEELADVLSGDLKDELSRLSSPFDQGAPSDAELRVAHAQLVGWLEGLFHGIQAMLFAQQMEGRQRLEELRRRGLPAPQGPGEQQPGQYL